MSKKVSKMSKSAAAKVKKSAATMLEKRINPTRTPITEVSFASQLLSPSVSAAEPSITATYTLHGISYKLLRVSSGKKKLAINLTKTMIRKPINKVRSKAMKIEELPRDI